MPPVSNQPAPLDPNYYMQPSNTPAPGSGKRKKIIIAAIVVILLMLIISIGAVIGSRGQKKQASSSNKDAQAVAQEFLGHLNFNREDEAYNMYVPHNQPNKSDMKQFMATVPNMVDPSQCKLEGEETNPELAYTYACPSRSKNEEGMKLKITLLSVGDGYKIVSCRFVGKA